MQPLTQQELGLHLIARYLVSDTLRLKLVGSKVDYDTLFSDYIYNFGISRIPNTEDSSYNAYIVYDYKFCTTCSSCTREYTSRLFDSACNNCKGVGLYKGAVYKADWYNRYLPAVDTKYKLKLAEILWQTYLRKLL